MIIRLSKNSVLDLKKVVSYGFMFFGESRACNRGDSNVIFNYDDEEEELGVESLCDKDAFVKLTEEQYEKLNNLFMSMLSRDAHFFDAYAFVKDMLIEK